MTRQSAMMADSEIELVALPGGPTQVEWRRHARARRISLRIDARAGGVVVTLPPRAGRRAGMALLMTHAGWVSDRLAALPKALLFEDGATIPIDGMPHRIRHVPGRGGAWLAGDELHVTGEPEFLRRRVADFLRAEAGRRFAPMAVRKASEFGLSPRRVAVKDTHTRWGSCAPDGSIALCWRLIMAPDWVQDYVIGHEIAHLRHMNHGARFWELVHRLTPHTDRAIAWLRVEGARLMRIG